MRVDRFPETSSGVNLRVLERTLVEFLQQLADREVEFAQGEELAMAQSGDDSAFGDLHSDLDFGFVAGFSRARG